MHMTHHITTRMNQRGIRKDLIDLTLDLGDIDGDRFVLSSKIIDKEMSDLQRRLKMLSDARKKGGIVVVADGDHLITAYHKNSFNAKLAQNS
ncbi:hypothetical protein JQX09_24020 [Sulfitobacter pseudonitzschiae]|uniref:Uncharacterized protein n=1 Tax=Pseudosulfitobacter pseudonitzschiae TaxID=1402135 RepID=A0A9Q2NRF2_9RHOB|nr:hypothetical protein [Pseudosulfitobacter pseudonitzschiae]MBM2294998.1 hypothetical protein [Pseudosulfitobacter pseudonitzschiae]MBM2299913.1 hypothetical protein [Pseudosulfitobacter pseudonitzschiae]MBM2304836.1 hypothetical protein [Pseudosulfitobacter pseudonitzschiae]MBM2314609.1 hypothetical protein [Pseudosulfitobacter pseudonitzschiae]MBM2319519.1 hypothetical protein [Pseudosulfitobacter pseudonitzschiae]